MRSHRPRSFPGFLRAASLLAIAVLGCDELAGPGFPGEPLVTLRGEFIGTVASPDDRPDHLAFAWLNYDLRRTDIGWVSTQEVPLEGGALPLTYEFGIFSPPPELLLNDNGLGTGKIAYGTLIAYRDLNGNGVLDPIPAGGTVIDRVVGASSEFVGSPTMTYFEVAYVVGRPPADPPGLKQGFNLVTHEGVRPLDTSIPITLAYKPVNNLFLCEAISADVLSDAAWNLCLGPGPVRTFGLLYLTDTAAHAAMGVYSGEGLHADAEVTVNGVALAYDPDVQQYLGVDATRTMFAPSSIATVRVAVPGRAPVEFPVQVMSDFAITGPANGSSFARTDAIPLRWTRSEGNWRFQLTHSATDAGLAARRYGFLGDVTAFDVPPLPGVETVTGSVSSRLSLTTFNRFTDDNGTDIQARIRHQVDVTYAP